MQLSKISGGAVGQAGSPRTLGCSMITRPENAKITPETEKQEEKSLDRVHNTGKCYQDQHAGIQHVIS